MEKKNNMYYKPQYKCGICEKIYDSIAERTACESACLKKQEEEAKKAEAAKKAAEKSKRYEKIVEVANNYDKLVKEFIKDYGSIELVSKDYVPYLSKILGGWF